MSAQTLEVVANGLRHRVLRWGDHQGEQVVLLHGFLDQADSFQWLAPHLTAAGYGVVALDFRGHGHTEWIGKGGYYHFPDYVLDLHELLPQVLGEGRFHLLGHSMGGTVATLYAASHVERIVTLTLIEGLGPPDMPLGAGPDKLGTWLASVERRRARSEAPITLEDATERMRKRHGIEPELARELATLATREVEGGLRAWRFDPMHRTTSPSIFSAQAFAEHLGRITAPTLIVTGQHGFVTTDHADRVGALPDAREILLEGVGHMIHWLRPAELAEHVLAHVRSGPSRSEHIDSDGAS